MKPWSSNPPQSCKYAERAVPPLRKPPISPSQRHQGFRAPRAAAVAKPEKEVPSPKSSSSRQQGFRVWRAAAVFKRESAAGRPPLEQQSLWGSRAAAANLGPAASSLSFPPVGLRVWRAAAVARLERPTVSGTAKEPEVAIKTVSNLDEGRGRLSELDGAAGEAGPVTPSSSAIEPEAGEHLPAADLHDFDRAYKRALKEVVYDPDVERRFANDATAASVPLVRRRSSLKLAVCAAVVASVGVMPWIVPSFTEAVPSLTQRLTWRS